MNGSAPSAQDRQAGALALREALDLAKRAQGELARNDEVTALLLSLQAQQKLRQIPVEASVLAGQRSLAAASAGKLADEAYGAMRAQIQKLLTAADAGRQGAAIPPGKRGGRRAPTTAAARGAGAETSTALKRYVENVKNPKHPDLLQRLNDALCAEVPLAAKAVSAEPVWQAVAEACKGESALSGAYGLAEKKLGEIRRRKRLLRVASSVFGVLVLLVIGASALPRVFPAQPTPVPTFAPTATLLPTFTHTPVPTRTPRPPTVVPIGDALENCSPALQSVASFVITDTLVTGIRMANITKQVIWELRLPEPNMEGACPLERLPGRNFSLKRGATPEPVGMTLDLIGAKLSSDRKVLILEAELNLEPDFAAPSVSETRYGLSVENKGAPLPVLGAQVALKWEITLVTPTPAATNTSSPTATPTSTLTPQPTRRPLLPLPGAPRGDSNQPGTALAPYDLVCDPKDTSSDVSVQWKWDGTLQENDYFEIRLWKVGSQQGHWGATALTKNKSDKFKAIEAPNFKGAEGIPAGGNGEYYLSVAVIRKVEGKPNEAVSGEASPCKIKITGPGDGPNPCPSGRC